MNDSGELVTVFTSQGPWGAEVAKSKLESAGLKVALRWQSVGRTLGLTVDGLGRVEVQVRAEDAVEARALLEEEVEEASTDATDLDDTLAC